jgi:molecular chaperone HtpG
MINIPAKLNNLLNAFSDENSAAVGTVIGSVGPFLQRNEAPFFSDYTDHGVQHIESVLKTCELVISEEAWNEFTRQDVAVLVLATLAHDIGMLINIDGFRSLINPETAVPLIESKDLPWDKLWREFQSEVRRFDGATLLNLSGSPEPIDISELDPYRLTERGVKFVGEFLRRHHHRLAQEIVLYGMPAENGRAPLFAEIPEYLRSLTGIVAWSHGVSLRESIEAESINRLDQAAHRQFRNIHPTFLMAIVRISDYLDLDIGRAPDSILSAKSLRSPISRREWWSHRAVIDCHAFGDDPECLRIVVEPSALRDVDIFSVTEDKIRGVQEELDACWAVLGEVYGRVPPLNKLSLRLRRVRSNLRNQSIVEQLAFVPHRASLQSARADLLKLLIEPLYGDRPSIGIRELIQNAVDAVREFEFIASEKPSLSDVDREPLKADIVISFEKDGQDATWVTVADRGIGMTWDTVSKYYLTAGASFRKSDVWKKDFTDETGRSLVLRSGRFGVGVLAAFLIGDRIKVSTRHIEEQESRGIQFEFGFDDTSIELRWMKRKAGTTVSVRTSEAILSRLLDYKPSHRYYDRDNWDWYCLEKPSLIRLNRDGKEIKPKFKLPGINGPLPVGWHRIQAPDFQFIDWSYKQGQLDLICNGIRISMGGIYLGKQFDNSKDYYRMELILGNPSVSVFDPDGRLPLNLARDDLARRQVGFEPALAEDVCRNFIAFCLVRGPRTRMLNDNLWNSYVKPEYPGCYDLPPIGYIFDSQDGFGFCDPWNISHFSSSKCLIIRWDGKSPVLPQSLVDYALNTYEVMFASGTDSTWGKFDRWHRRLLLYYTKERLSIFKNLRLRGLRVIMPDKCFSRLKEMQPQFITRKLNTEEKNAEYSIVRVGVDDLPSLSADFFAFAEGLKTAGFSYESITEVFFKPTDERPSPGLIAQVWKDAINGPIIPFDLTKRNKIIDGLDERFHHHLAQWTAKKD